MDKRDLGRKGLIDLDYWLSEYIYLGVAADSVSDSFGTPVITALHLLYINAQFSCSSFRPPSFALLQDARLLLVLVSIVRLCLPVFVAHSSPCLPRSTSGSCLISGVSPWTPYLGRMSHCIFSNLSWNTTDDSLRKVSLHTLFPMF